MTPSTSDRAERLARRIVERALDNAECASQFELPDVVAREAFAAEFYRLATLLVEAEEGLRETSDLLLYEGRATPREKLLSLLSRIKEVVG